MEPVVERAVTAATIAHLLHSAPRGAPAIAAPGGRALSFAALAALAERTVAALNAAGIGRGDRVAIALPEGPGMAAAFVAIAAGAAAAPLNPAWREGECRRHLEHLGARLLVAAPEEGGPAAAAARGLGLGLAVAGEGGSALEVVHPPPAGPAPRRGFAAAGDAALVLHTSGTTARPKAVPLTQANLVASARHIAASLALTPEDRCLNLMPLFHIHGLAAALLASLAAGASVHCPPGFNALRAFAWMEAASPSWLTAVPTMHQALLARAPRNRERLAKLSLRLLRSSSAPLPPTTMAELEAVFGCPAIEAYGMTEAAHQMTSNPLPPARRHAGSVGVAAGPRVAILAEGGARPLPAGEVGEVAVRGPNVMAGYENDPQANAAAFVDGWFRTGDQGVLDGAGYLRLTGRLKEIINRGGEKIAPREVDEALLAHPAVAQALAFALPHPRLGEEVAAAVVLKEGARAGERQLAAFVAERLAAFKVPRRLLFLDEIPKGATGKPQRVGLARRLGLA